MSCRKSLVGHRNNRIRVRESWPLLNTISPGSYGKNRRGARSFAGDAAQVKALIKAALGHNGLAIIDIVSPCVTFNNADDAHYSYEWGKENEVVLHDLSYVPIQEEIILEGEFPEGTTRTVMMHDGSQVILKKVDKDYDPTDRMAALRVVEEAVQQEVLLTGLIYIETDRTSLWDIYKLPKSKPLNRYTQQDLRPAKKTIKKINEMMF